MPRISEKKIQRIKEDIISLLYENNIKPLFTSHVAEELARDEEFILRLLKELKDQGIVKQISKNSDGKRYLSRKRWTLKPEVYSKYKQLIN